MIVIYDMQENQFNAFTSMSMAARHIDVDYRILKRAIMSKNPIKKRFVVGICDVQRIKNRGGF